MKRRTFLQGTIAAGAAGLAVSAGLLTPSRVMANAFEAKTLADALAGIGASGAADSADVKIKAPEIAENGAVVPVTVTSGVAGTNEISILVQDNPLPLVATFMLGEGAKPEVSTRIKMGKTSNVVAIAKAGGAVHSAKQEVKVTIGGCGG